MSVFSSYEIPVQIEGIQFFQSNNSFDLESETSLPNITIAYHTYGTLNANKDNVIWVCHALTANSAVANWWSGCFGKGKMFDPEDYFIVCANILGSNYGTTCPRSINPKTGKAYGMDFPLISLRDMVKAHQLLLEHLQIRKIAYCVGGSCGGHQVLEMALLLPDVIQSMVLLVCGAKESPWAIASHEAQRMALETDPTFYDNTNKAGWKGLRAARAMALLLYRTQPTYKHLQEDTDERLDNFSASSYVNYQGLKLERRFYAHAYWTLSKALDTYDLGRGRGGVETALSTINIPALIISMDTDLLIPPSEQKILADFLPLSTYKVINTPYGHDGFLIETDQINQLFAQWSSQI